MGSVCVAFLSNIALNSEESVPRTVAGRHPVVLIRMTTAFILVVHVGLMTLSLLTVISHLL